MISEKIYLYENRKDVTLTTYCLDDSQELLDGKKRPAILICPGGGYLSCSDREGEPVALAFAAMGYHAFVLRYSVYSENDPQIIERLAQRIEEIGRKEKTMYPAPMRDIGKAMLYINERADEWLVDTEKIVLCGFSAGAHNVAMYSTHWHEPVICDFLKVSKEKLRPAACITGYMVSDYILVKDYDPTPGSLEELLSEMSGKAFFGTGSANDEILKAASPARHVTEFTPPMFIWATAADKMVPVQHSLRMGYALADAGIPFELHIFEEGEHGLVLATQASAKDRRQIQAEAAKWIPMAEAWLEKRFALPVEEVPVDETMENGSGE